VFSTDIVEHWDAFADAPSSDRDIHVYSSGAEIALAVNSKAIGTMRVGGWHNSDPESGATPGGVTFSKVAWASGEITATCTGVNNPAKSMTHTRRTSKKGTKITLRVDAPSPLTGTGKALLADGQDTGLLAAIITDADGNIDHGASNNVTFKIVSGPAKVVATHNGDVQNHEPNLADWHSAYHGMARGVIRVTQNAASAPWHRSRLAQIDVEHEAGPTELIAPGAQMEATEIVVEASSPGLASGRATIVLSTDAATDGVLAVAAASVTDPLHIE
jgi:hypothetical protein